MGTVERVWRGAVPAHRADEYLAYLQETGLADYAATPGHIGTTILRRERYGAVEFELRTRWESLDAIRAFAGDDPTRARYYPRDREFLIARPERVEHWTHVSAPGRPPRAASHREPARP